MTLEQEIQQLKDKYAEKEAELKREHAVLEHFREFLDAGYRKPFVFFSKLYGKRGSVRFGFERYSSLKEGKKDADAALLSALLERFPGQPKTMYRDSCVGFRPEANAIAEADRMKERGMKAELTAVEPVTVSIEPASFSNTAKFEWDTEIDGELWEIEVEFPIYQTDIGVLTIRYDYWRQGGHESEVRRILECEFRPHTGQRLRYSRADEKTPNHFVVYWLRGLQKPDYAAMVKAVQS